MDVTPQELRSSEIKDSWRGYDRDEVDDLLERAAVTIESLTQKVQEAASRPVPAAPAAPAPGEVPLPSSREDADMLQRTLLLAQRAADDAVNEAQARARQLLEESEAKAQSLVSDAEATARRIAEGERRRLEAEILDLSARREQLRADADALDAYASGYRERIRTAIESDLANLGGEVEPPSTRPELHDVELPPERDTAPVAAAVEHGAEPERESAEAAILDVVEDQSTWDPGPDTRAIPAVDRPSGGTPASSAPFAAEASAGPSPVAAPPRPMPAPAPAAAEWPPPAPSPEASAAATPAADSSWLSSDDDWAPGEQSWDAPAPWERDTAHHDPFPSDVPMEANAVDTDALDDDAFFASLREAVRDDAPLGPRDDDQATFFDGAAEQDRRRFRRRR
jgi:DivIVA domain-containing protein